MADGEEARSGEKPDESSAALSEGLEELASLGVFQLQLSGALVESMASAAQGLYFEWNRVLARRDGEGQEPPYSVYQDGGSQGEPVLFETPVGTFTAPAASVTLFLQPRIIENFGKTLREGDPAWVSAMRAGLFGQDGGVDILLVEYCLEPKRDYWAEVETRHECLPPQPPSSEPLYQPYLRLRLSDRPFSSGENLGWPTIGTAPLP